MREPIRDKLRLLHIQDAIDIILEHTEGMSSFARGEEKPGSDVDILVEFDHSAPIVFFAHEKKMLR